MFENSNKKQIIKPEQRCFSDNPNLNNKYSRESEVAAQMQAHELHLRDTEGPKQNVFALAASPNSFCELHQAKSYQAG
jgi:hypothetical protein